MSETAPAATPASPSGQDGAVPGMSPAALGPISEYLGRATQFLDTWMAKCGPMTPHPSQNIDAEKFAATFDELTTRLSANHPFFHPRYAGQMLKPPHPAAVVGYLTTMLINPNNHDLDAGAATTRMEQECVDQIARMFGCTATRTESDGVSYGEADGDSGHSHASSNGMCHLGHLTTSGTLANLEALFVARETHPRKSIAHSADAHYTHGRMSHLLGVPSVEVPTDARGRMDLDALEALISAGGIGTVVLTAGTTGLGAVDPIDKAIPLCRKYGVRVHVDGAYGGFFRLLADEDDDALDPEVAAAFRAIDQADSVVIDPHKHGLQPYGCGAVLFRDPNVANFYDHTSPYTYFTTGDDIHMGEISLECSRSGASAAGLWMTLQLLPLTRDGLGAVIRPGREAALAWADKLRTSASLELYQEPDIDIVSYFPKGDTLAEIDRLSGAVLDGGMNAPRNESLFVATYQVKSSDLADRGFTVGDADHAAPSDGGSDEPARDGDGREAAMDADKGARILRSVTMKPEHLGALDDIHANLERLVDQAH